MRQLLTLCLLLAGLSGLAQTEGNYFRVTTVVDVFFSNDTLNVVTTDSTFRDTIPVTVGPAGLSAYEIWLDEGNSGSITEFLNSLIGAPGATGDPGSDGSDGLSAYQIWLNEGNTGTPSDFLTSLIGASGQDGSPGLPGNDGNGIASTSYDAGTGVLTFTFDDATTYQTGDLRGPPGAPGQDGQDGISGGSSEVEIAFDALHAEYTGTSGSSIQWGSVNQRGTSMSFPQNYRVQFDSSGWYRVSASVEGTFFVAQNSDNDVNAQLFKTGVSHIAPFSREDEISAGNFVPFTYVSFNLEGIFQFTVGERIEVQVSGGVTVNDARININRLDGFVTIPQGPAGVDGVDGAPGVDGNGIASSSYDPATGLLTLTFDDASTFDTGDLRGPQGPAGVDGTNGVNGNGIASSSYDAGTGILTLTFDDASTFDTGDLRGGPGPQGAPGADGFGINVIGTVPDSLSLNQSYTGGVGDLFIADDDGSGYAWVGTGWVNLGTLRGPAGVDGTNGVDGNGIASTSYDPGTGVLTITYDDASTFQTTDLRGPQGLQGPQGLPGPPGATGATGPQGALSDLSYFRATKNGNQNTTTSLVDIIGWDEDATTDDVSFNTTTGIATINEAAPYLVLVDVQADQVSGSNRTQMTIQLSEDTGGGFSNSTETTWSNYSQRNSTQREGGIYASVPRTYNVGDQLKLRVEHVGTAVQIQSDMARLSIIRLSGVAGASGGVWRTGSGVPSDGLGEDGDFYIDTATNDFYERVGGGYVLRGTFGSGGGGADNLGDHNATQDVLLNGFSMRDEAGDVKMTPTANEFGFITEDNNNRTVIEPNAHEVEFFKAANFVRGITGNSPRDHNAWKIAVGTYVDQPTTLPTSDGQFWTNNMDGSGQWATPGTGDGDGTPGPQGQPGDDGATWLTGTGIPSSGLGENDDLYLRIGPVGEGDVYKKESGFWAGPIINIMGAPGSPGADGVNGEEGSKFYSGTGTPSNAIYNNDDVYLDADLGDLYQKSGGSWFLVANLTGPAGPPGGNQSTTVINDPSGNVDPTPNDIIRLSSSWSNTITIRPNNLSNGDRFMIHELNPAGAK
jgi:hypothetical protein